MGARRAILAQVGLVRGGEQAALRDRDQPLGADPRGEELQQLRRGRVGDIVDADDAGAFGRHEHQLLPVPVRHDHRLGLDTLGVRAAFGIVADRHDRLFELARILVGDGAVLVPDGEAAAAALPVAFVGGDEMVGVDPRDSVRFAQAARLGAAKVEPAVILGVDPVQVDSARAEGRGDLAVGADDRDVVVFLKRDDDLAGFVERHVFGFGIVARDLGDAGQVDLGQPGAVGAPVLDRDGHHIARGHLRQVAVVHVLVALVLDRDGQHRPVRVPGDRIRLPAKVAAFGHGARGKVHGPQRARRRGERFRRVHAHECGVADDHGRGRLTFHGDVAERFGRGGVGDVDAADHAQGAVRIDQRVAVFRRGHDLGRGLARLVLAVGHVGGRGERRDAVEHRIGKRGRRGDERQDGAKGKGQFHRITSRGDGRKRCPRLLRRCREGIATIA